MKLNVDKLFRAVKYRPHPGQVEIHGDETRNQVVSAGRRFGKSRIGGKELLVEAVRTRYILPHLEQSGQRREFWIVGPEYTDSEKEYRDLWNTLKAIEAPFDKPGSYYDAHSGDMQLSMYDGKFLCLGKSAKHPERLVGEGINGVIMAEAAKQTERTWTKFIRPMLADYRGWAKFTSTPEGKNWFYDLYMRGQDPNDKQWRSWRKPAWANPHVYPMGASDRGIARLRSLLVSRNAIDIDEASRSLGIDPEIIELVMDLSEETFKQEIAADFTEFAGRVFKEFDDEYHVRDLPFNPTWRTYGAVDYGFTNPFVWLLIQEDPHYGTVHVIDELYESGLAIDDAARLIKSRGLAPDGLIEFFPDPAEPGDTLALERHLRVRGNRDTGGELKLRLRYIREALRDFRPHLPHGHPERHPKLMIDRRCENTIREMNDYRYPRKAKEVVNQRNPNDLPLDKDNHCPEALGRFYRGKFGAAGGGAGGGARVAGSTLSQERTRRRNNTTAGRRRR